jgi:hypothetical protein
MYPQPFTHTQMKSTRCSSPVCNLSRLAINSPEIFACADEEWSKEETDYLFSLMREYEARWFVVHDRYDFPGGSPRTMEV